MKNVMYCWSQAASDDFYNKACKESVRVFSTFFWIFAGRNSLPSDSVPPPRDLMGQPLAALNIPRTRETILQAQP